MKKGLSFFVLALLVITGQAVAIDESLQSITKEKTVHTNNALWRTIKSKTHETLWTGNNLQTSSNSITTIHSDLTSTTEAVTDNDGGGSCSSQSDCNWQGNCLNNECYCFPLYSGDYCTKEWTKQYHNFDTVLMTYRAFAVLLNAVCLAFAIYQLWMVFVLSPTTGRSFWSVTTWILVGLLLAAALRVSYFVMGLFYVGPSNLQGNVLSTILFNFPILVWIDVGLLLVVYWMNLINYTRVKQVQFYARFKPFVFAMSIIYVGIFFGLASWNDIRPSIVTLAIYDCLLLAIQAFMIIASIISGRRVIRLIRELWVSTGNTDFKMYLDKVTKFVWGINIVLILFVMSLIAYAVTDSVRNPWGWVVLHLVMRILEFAAVMFILLLIKKKKPSNRVVVTYPTSDKNAREYESARHNALYSPLGHDFEEPPTNNVNSFWETDEYNSFLH